MELFKERKAKCLHWPKFLDVANKAFDPETGYEVPTSKTD
jgi:hypothetical protein